jgi:hypothetical protein
MMEVWSEPYGLRMTEAWPEPGRLGMADADLSHMGDGVMDTWLESYERWHCRWMVQTVGVGADNVPKPRRLELVSGGCGFFFSYYFFQILLKQS